MPKLPWSFRLRQAWELIVHGTDTRYEVALTIIQELALEIDQRDRAAKA